MYDKFITLGLIGLFMTIIADQAPYVPQAPAVPQAMAVPQPESWLGQIQKDIAEAEYHVSHNGIGLQAPNRANDLRIYFDTSGIEVKDRTDELGPMLLRLRLTGMDRMEKTLGDTASVSCGRLADGELSTKDNRVDIEREGITEWYINKPVGLKHGFTIPCRPKGKGTLRLHVQVQSAEARLEGDHVIFGTSSRRKLKYSDLFVYDAQGKNVPASFEVPDPGTIRIIIRDRVAVYPLNVDPLLFSVPDTIVESDQAYARMGFSVSGAGDVNGDGFDDVIVGAKDFDNGQTNEGVAFVFHGSASGITTTAAAILESNVASAKFGYSVSGAGDVNGDGFGDVIVGASEYENGHVSEGAVYMFHGSASGLKATPVLIVQSNQAGARLGASVSGAGDVNGDGYADVIAGADYYSNGQSLEGAVFVFHGSPSGVMSPAATMVESNQGSSVMGYSISGAGDVNGDGYSDVAVGTPRFDNGEIDEGVVFIYHGGPSGISTTPATMVESNQGGALLGLSVSGAGDVNGDGYADLIVGAPEYDNGQLDEGVAFVYHGTPNGLSTMPAITLEYNLNSLWMGNSVSGAGDVNGDGYADVLVGAANWDNPSYQEGAVFIYHGSANGIHTSNAERVESDITGAYLGCSVSCAGDVNGDGYDDIIAGAYGYTNGQVDEGAAFIYHGGGNGVSYTASTLVESDQVSALLGLSVSDAGDVNGDGFDDILVGATHFDNGQADEGAAFVYHGSAAGLSSYAAAMVESDQAACSFGYSVSGAGDVNGDGFADILVGAPLYDHGSTDEGVAFVYHGSTTGIITQAATSVESDMVAASLGWSVSGAGDVNGDGYTDVIVGAPNYSNNQLQEGAFFVYHGGASGISTTPAVMVESDLDTTYLGYSVSGAGDVNGDGFADVIVGATGYDNGDIDEGAVFIHHGGPSGISITPDTIMESDFDYANFGISVSGAGDLNGDGFADVIVGAWKYHVGLIDEGGAFVYHGSPTGVSTMAANVLHSVQKSAFLGGSVSGAGDVNGDGYSDVIVGAAGYDNIQVDEGAAFIYHGGPFGIYGIPELILEGNQDYALFGHSVSGAGDVNGDGFADVIIGAPFCDLGQVDEGAAFLHLGNSEGATVMPSQLRGDSSMKRVPPWGMAHHTDRFRVSMHTIHPEGRGRVKLEVECYESGTAFGTGSHITVTSPAWVEVPAGGAGVTLTETITGLTNGTLYRWRARILYAPLTVTQPGITPPAHPRHGPWRRVSSQMSEADIRVGDPVIQDLEADTGTIHGSTGGAVHFTLNAGASNANRNYLLLGGVTGTSPGTPMPGGHVVLPLNMDAFTNLVFSLLNTSMFKNFMGVLDGNGSGTATMDTLGPFTIGGPITLYFAYCLTPPFDFVSNPVLVVFVP